MNRRSLFALFAGAAVSASRLAESQTPPANATDLSRESIEFLSSQLVKRSSRPHESSMEELAARLTWVWMGRILPDEARQRTILRANSSRSEKVGFLGFGEEIGPTKRSFCMAIIALDDKLRTEKGNGNAEAGG